MGLGRWAMQRPKDQATLTSSILYFSHKSQESSHTYATIAEVTPHVATSTSSLSATRARATSTLCLSPSASRPRGPGHMLLVLRHPQRSHRRLGSVGWRRRCVPFGVGHIWFDFLDDPFDHSTGHRWTWKTSYGTLRSSSGWLWRPCSGAKRKQGGRWHASSGTSSCHEWLTLRLMLASPRQCTSAVGSVVRRVLAQAGGVPVRGRPWS
jgi:hypothetical protein